MFLVIYSSSNFSSDFALCHQLHEDFYNAPTIIVTADCFKKVPVSLYREDHLSMLEIIQVSAFITRL